MPKVAVVATKKAKLRMPKVAVVATRKAKLRMPKVAVVATRTLRAAAAATRKAKQKKTLRANAAKASVVLSKNLVHA